MSNAQDVALTIAKESAYGTAVVTSRAFEFLQEGLTFRKKVNDSPAYRYGARVKSSAGRTVVTSDAGGDVKFELGTRGFGLLWEAALGSSTSTQVGVTTVYQQNHTIGDALPSLTVQKVLPAIETDASFSDAAFTFDGAMVSSWTLEVPQAGAATLALSLDCHDVDTAVAAATPVYPDDNHVLSFAGACLYTGTLTAPTASALASATAPVANVKAVTITSDNKLAGDATYYFCGGGKKGKPWKGSPAISGTLTVEFHADGPFVQAFLADTPMALLLNLAAVENADEKVQVVLPEVFIDGDLPKAAGNPGVIELSVPFVVYQNADGDEPVTVVCRTYDTAL